MTTLCALPDQTFLRALQSLNVADLEERLRTTFSPQGVHYSFPAGGRPSKTDETMTLQCSHAGRSTASSRWKTECPHVLVFRPVSKSQEAGNGPWKINVDGIQKHNHPPRFIKSSKASSTASGSVERTSGEDTIEDDKDKTEKPGNGGEQKSAPPRKYWNDHKTQKLPPTITDLPSSICLRNTRNGSSHSASPSLSPEPPKKPPVTFGGVKTEHRPSLLDTRALEFRINALEKKCNEQVVDIDRSRKREQNTANDLRREREECKKLEAKIRVESNARKASEEERDKLKEELKKLTQELAVKERLEALGEKKKALEASNLKRKTEEEEAAIAEKKLRAESQELQKQLKGLKRV